MIIIDANETILGRLATIAAKKALMGETVNIINSEKAIIIGTKKNVIGRYKKKFDRGSMRKGPFFPKTPERFVKRTIRGMLPYKQEKGLLAFKRITCYKGIPDKLKGKEAITLENYKASKLKTINYGNVETICRELGGKL